MLNWRLAERFQIQTHLKCSDQVALTMKQDCPLIGADVDIARVCKRYFERSRTRRRILGRTRRKDKISDDEWRLADIERSVHLIKGFLYLLTADLTTVEDEYQRADTL